VTLPPVTRDKLWAALERRLDGELKATKKRPHAATPPPPPPPPGGGVRLFGAVPTGAPFLEGVPNRPAAAVRAPSPSSSEDSAEVAARLRFVAVDAADILAEAKAAVEEAAAMVGVGESSSEDEEEGEGGAAEAPPPATDPPPKKAKRKGKKERQKAKAAAAAGGEAAGQ
jgi:hypothetical protein